MARVSLLVSLIAVACLALLCGCEANPEDHHGHRAYVGYPGYGGHPAPGYLGHPSLPWYGYLKHYGYPAYVARSLGR